MFENPLHDPTAIGMLSVVGLVAIGLITNGIWDYFKENFTYASAAWPKVKGQWKVLRTERGEPQDQGERVFIKQQFGAKFRGEMHTPFEDGKMVIQNVRGEFLDRYHAVYSFRQMGNDYTQMGAGLFTLDPSQHQAVGRSVYFGLHMDDARSESEVSMFVLKKVQ
jgi:hypothetical protein